jgi:hypothetical protein
MTCGSRDDTQGFFRIPAPSYGADGEIGTLAANVPVKRAGEMGSSGGERRPWREQVGER